MNAGTLSGFLDSNLDKFGLVLASLVTSSARTFMFFSLLPLLERAVVPTLPRSIIGLGLGAFAAPSAYFAFVDSEPGLLAIALILAKEAFVGLLLAFPPALAIWSIEAAGIIIDTQRGASSGSISDPVTSNESQPTAALLKFVFVCYLLTSGAFLRLLDALYASYAAWPVADYTPTLTVSGAAFLTEITGDLFASALILAAPVMLAMFLTEMSLLYAARFAPQMNVFVLAMPAKSGIGYLVLCLYFTGLFDLAMRPVWQADVWVRHMLELLQ